MPWDPKLHIEAPSNLDTAEETSATRIHGCQHGRLEGRRTCDVRPDVDHEVIALKERDRLFESPDFP
jgi:hypothetical protein